jgi:hypothetical protein
MRHNIDPEAPKLCNNCSLKEERKKNQMEKDNSKSGKAKMLIECDHKMQIEIEEYCINHGVSISNYFVGLHRAHQASIECNQVITIKDDKKKKK